MGLNPTRVLFIPGGLCRTTNVPGVMYSTAPLCNQSFYQACRIRNSGQARPSQASQARSSHQGSLPARPSPGSLPARPSQSSLPARPSQSSLPARPSQLSLPARPCQACQPDFARQGQAQPHPVTRDTFTYPDLLEYRTCGIHLNNKDQ